MKIASWILTGIAYALLIATVIGLIITGAPGGTGDVETEFILTAVFCTAVMFCLPGFIGHMLIVKYKKNNADIGKDGLAVYILSFVPFIIPYIVLLVVALLVWLIDAIVYLFTSRHYVLKFAVWVWDLTFGTGKNKQVTASADSVIIVTENGLDRALVFWGYANSTSDQNLQLSGPTPAYRDDVGNFWISADGQHFTPVNRGLDNDCSISKA